MSACLDADEGPLLAHGVEEEGSRRRRSADWFHWKHFDVSGVHGSMETRSWFSTPPYACAKMARQLAVSTAAVETTPWRLGSWLFDSGYVVVVTVASATASSGEKTGYPVVGRWYCDVDDDVDVDAEATSHADTCDGECWRPTADGGDKNGEATTNC